jgi:AcrR family transcriptional regulator
VPWGSISREQVIEAATRIIRSGGYESMTIRHLAEELGVAPMSLYRHVRDKDDLLDEVVDRLLAGAWRPHVSRSKWKEWVAETAERLRAFLVGQPAAMHVYLRHPVVSPEAVIRMHAMMDVLCVALGDDAAPEAYAAIHTYTIGFAALEASRAGASDAELDGLAAQLASFTTREQFSSGLHHLLRGLEHAPVIEASESRASARGTRSQVQLH